MGLAPTRESPKIRCIVHNDTTSPSGEIRRAAQPGSKSLKRPSLVFLADLPERTSRIPVFQFLLGCALLRQENGNIVIYMRSLAGR
jgi:hypothetical protein